MASTSSAEAAFAEAWSPFAKVGNASLYVGDCLEWLAEQPPHAFHGVVTDPPYGIVEYTPQQQRKLRRGQGGVWRLPPAFDGHQRSPLPRFTTLTAEDLDSLCSFFRAWAEVLVPGLVPGSHVLVASNPLVSHLVASAICSGGLERRGEVVRLVMTLRGGDRPKNAHEEFSGVTVMPRLQVGALAAVSQAARGACPRQPPNLGHGWTATCLRREAIRGRDLINSHTPSGAETRAAPQPQASGVPPKSSTCHPAARHRYRPRSVRGLRLDAGSRRACRLSQRRRRARPDLCAACGICHSQAARLRAGLGRVVGKVQIDPAPPQLRDSFGMQRGSLVPSNPRSLRRKSAVVTSAR